MTQEVPTMIQTIEPTAPSTSTWTLDPAHSSIHFAGRQMMISTVRGRFTRFEAAVVGSELQPEQASVEVTVDAASVDSGVAPRDQHLMSGDFLDVEHYPHITFKLRVQGDLTIKDVTRPVSFEASFNGLAVGMSGARRAAFTAELTIDRRDWGITWNMPLGTDAVLVGTHITLQFELTVEESTPAPTETAAVA
jgi:polyisoprenoid-binding protein YceI